MGIHTKKQQQTITYVYTSNKKKYTSGGGLLTKPQMEKNDLKKEAEEKSTEKER